MYIMTNLKNTVLYTGVTSGIANRVCEHRVKIHSNSFTARYNCVKLVYFQKFDIIEEAILEEKRIKGGPRRQKEALINAMNPEWKDLFEKVQHLGVG